MYGAPEATVDKLQRAQNSVDLAVLSASGRADARPLLRQLHCLPVRQRVFYKTTESTRRVNTTGVPAYLKEHLVQRVPSRQTRSAASPCDRYCLSRDWPLISQDVNCPTPHLSFRTVCLQKSCCARNIVLKNILRHSCLTAVTRPSDRYLTSAPVAFCGHI